MCNSKILHLNEHGCISMCTECSKIQVCFGTTVTTHSRSEFEEFCIYIKKMNIKYADTDNIYAKKVFIRTALDNLSFVYSSFDLVNLDDLLSQAKAIITVQSILDSSALSERN